MAGLEEALYGRGEFSLGPSLCERYKNEVFSLAKHISVFYPKLNDAKASPSRAKKGNSEVRIVSDLLITLSKNQEHTETSYSNPPVALDFAAMASPSPPSPSLLPTRVRVQDQNSHPMNFSTRIVPFMTVSRRQRRGC
jgi:hypothetical protein